MCLDIVTTVVKDAVLKHCKQSGHEGDFERLWPQCMIFLNGKYVDKLNVFSGYNQDFEKREKLKEYLLEQSDIYINNLFNISVFAEKPRSSSFSNDFYGFEENKRLENIMFGLNKECTEFQAFIYKQLKKITLPYGYKLETELDFKSPKFEKKNIAGPSKIFLIKNRSTLDVTITTDINTLNKVKTYIQKYDTVQRMRADLNMAHSSSERKFENFNSVFNLKQTQDYLNAQIDSTAMRFLKNIGHLLTLGIVSKITKGTFRFWKTQEQLFIENINSISTHGYKGEIKMPDNAKTALPSMNIIPNP